MGIEHIIEASNQLYRDVTLELSNQTVKKYDREQKTLYELDQWRVEQLPQILADRHQREGSCWLTKEELVLLMDWKLAKGKFRPTLPKLIKSNSEESVMQATKQGFAILFECFREIGPDPEWSRATVQQEYLRAIKLVFKAFCELRGVGPATASLIGSLAAKANLTLTPPFFSDESFEYYVVAAQRPNTKIKYTIKEYCEELLPVYFEIMTRHKVVMITLEKGGWALKMYEMNRFGSLADIEVAFKVPEGHLARYKTPNTKRLLEDDANEGDPPKKKLKAQLTKNTSLIQSC